MSILQETPTYAFLLACQNIAARQSGSEDPALQAASPSMSSADPSSGSMSSQPSSSSSGSKLDKVQLGSASHAAAGTASAGAADAAAQGPDGGEVIVSGESASAGDVSMSTRYEDQEVQAVMDVVEPSLASEVSCP